MAKSLVVIKAVSFAINIRKYFFVMVSKQAKLVLGWVFFHKTNEKANGILYFAVECITL